MNISLLNNLIKKVYVNKCSKSFEDILVDIDNTITKAAHNTYSEYEDKILYSIEDIEQNIRIRIYMDFISILLNFKDIEQLQTYIYEVAEEALQEARS